MQRFGLLKTGQLSAALAGLANLGLPFAVAPVEQRHQCARSLPHHPEQVMRLIAVQRNRLPLTQRVIYIEPDLRFFHEGSI